MMNKLLIITNSYHRDVNLVERSLLHSLNQDDNNFEVYFVDQNEEKLILNPEVESHPKLTHFHRVVKCVSVARNSVQIPSDVDWLLFCDDDGYLQDNYIKRLREIIRNDPKLEIIAGSIVRDDSGEFYSPRHKVGGDLGLFKNSKLLMGSNFSCKVETFKKLDGFDEKFGAGSFWGSGEETDFAWKAHFYHCKMSYERGLVVYHVKPYSLGFKENVAKAFRYGVGKGALVSKWLFLRMKIKIIYEVVEMTLIPIGQMFVSLIKLRIDQFFLYLVVLVSRYIGMFLFLIKKKQE